MSNKFKVGDRVYVKSGWQVDDYDFKLNTVYVINKIDSYGSIWIENGNSAETVKFEAYFDGSQIVPEEIYESPLYKLMQEKEENDKESC